ncbi:hypothetical protein [Pseudochelatococcus contaminans]|uniref:hypothetical protein n=1 Tax=Pseudochelatococcus contaminans TaxID=1538103 RepID=UPI0016148338
MVVSATGAESLSLDLKPVTKTPTLLLLSCGWTARNAVAAQRRKPPSRAAPTLTFVQPEIELAPVGIRRQIHGIKGNSRTVPIDLATKPAKPGADRPVEIGGIGPGIGITIAHVSPARVGVERQPM